MTKPNVTKLINGAKRTLVKHSPGILTGLGIAGMITTTILAVKATPKAVALIEADSRENHDGDPHAYTKKEAIKSSWKCYIPAASTGLASIACLIGASSVHSRRNAALAAVYKLSESSFAEYKEKVVETIGEKKELAIRDKVAEDKVKNDPVTNNTVFITKEGDTLCYDAIFGRYFTSNMEAIKRAENRINKILLSDSYVSLNDFYSELDLEPTKIGNDLGWRADEGLIEIYFSSQLTDEGRPCLVINFETAPKYDYYKFA